MRRMTGVRNSSASSKLRTARSKHSCTVDGASAMISWSPCVPHRACITSPWAGSVACPVEGPDRCTFTMTQGVSVMQAYPIFSCMREKPGPLVAVMERAPDQAAPITAEMLASSSSNWT
jgi:hypothetical protein